MGILKEFKEFAMKGNLIDIAVAFVMGAAFNKVVSAFTGGIVSPLVGLIFKSDFKDLKWTIKDGRGNPWWRNYYYECFPSSLKYPGNGDEYAASGRISPFSPSMAT